MVVQMKAIAHLMVSSTFNAKPPGHDLLKTHELDEIVRDSKEKVVASYDL